jgi:peptide/nickel transport system permease protein
MPYLLRRLGFYIVAAWVAITFNFFIPRAMPGNAVQGIMAKFPSLTPAASAALTAMLGVGKGGSIWHQYVTYLNNVLHLNFGVDVSSFPASVSSILGAAIPWTLILVGTATVIAFLVGTGLGILAGWRHGGWLDRSLPVWMFFQAAPYFFIALVLVDFFAIEHHWLPVGQGFNGEVTSPGWTWGFISNALEHSILPA